jgi:hypothetical protein
MVLFLLHAAAFGGASGVLGQAVSPHEVMAAPSAVTSLVTTAQKETVFPNPSFDDVSSVIAGLPCSSHALGDICDSPVWKAYKRSMDDTWSVFRTKQLSPMKKWAETELPEVNHQPGILFYPFGGPDCITAFQFFPDADHYILIGQEPVGNLPDMARWSPRSGETYFNDLRKSFSVFFKRGYFITKDMNENLYGVQVDGVLPLICFFLKRNGDTIVGIKRISIDEWGNGIEEPYAPLEKRPKRPYGIRVLYSQGASGIVKSISYFSCDLSDKGFNAASKSFLYFERLGTMTVFLKSASYLLHYKTFSNIRELILRKGRYILEDDTGVPYRFFKQPEWSVKLYGRYAKPVKDFRGVDQPDLDAAYKADKTIKTLTFDLGYHWTQKTDALILAKRENKPLVLPNLQQRNISLNN